MKLIRQGLERGMFMTFGEKVRSLRKEKKMSQQELASMVGVSYRTIRSWEVEGRFPKQNVLYQKLADALQCDVSYLMSENEAFIIRTVWKPWCQTGSADSGTGCSYVCRWITDRRR